MLLSIAGRRQEGKSRTDETTSEGTCDFDRVLSIADKNRKSRNFAMMTAGRVMRYMTAEPFRPFRISMASGKVFEIRHPEMVQVGRTTMTIFTYLSDDAEEAKEREHEVSLLLVEAIEPIDAKTPAGNN